MLYKLIKIGLAGNFYNVIKDMYVGNNLRVRMQSGFTHSFSSSIGICLGDTLSPYLFKTFINDLPDIFYNSCMELILEHIILAVYFMLIMSYYYHEISMSVELFKEA